MSLPATRWVWECSGASGSDLLVLLALADFCDDAGEAFPRIDTLCAKTRLSRRAVQRSVAALVELGEVVVVESGVGRGNRPRYALPHAAGYPQDTPEKVSGWHVSGSRKGARIDAKRRQSVTPLRRTTREQSVNPPHPPSEVTLGTVDVGGGGGFQIEARRLLAERARLLGPPAHPDRWVDAVARRLESEATVDHTPRPFCDRCLSGWVEVSGIDGLVRCGCQRDTPTTGSTTGERPAEGPQRPATAFG